MKARLGIACGGNWLIDYVKVIDLWPEEGNLANVLEQKRGTGGSPYNVLIGLAKLKTGIPLEGIGIVGDDPDGEYIISHCKSYGIDMSAVMKTTKAPTSTTDVMTVKGTGRRTFFHNRGANKLLSDKHFDFSKIKSKLFHLGYILLLDILDQPDKKYGTKAAKVFYQAQKAGLKTSLDLVSEMSDRFTKLVPPVLPNIDYLIVNELEAGRTTGHQIRKGNNLNNKALKESAKSLFQMGVKEWVVIHYPEGGYTLTRSGEERFQNSLDLPDDYIKGTAGAGDAFCAGMLYGIHENWNLDKCLEMAVAAAAACLSDATTTDGMRSLKETLNLIKKYPLRK